MAPFDSGGRLSSVSGGERGAHKERVPWAEVSARGAKGRWGKERVRAVSRGSLENPSGRRVWVTFPKTGWVEFELAGHSASPPKEGIMPEPKTMTMKIQRNKNFIYSTHMLFRTEICYNSLMCGAAEKRGIKIEYLCVASFARHKWYFFVKLIIFIFVL